MNSYRTHIVTIIPKQTVYAGSWTNGTCSIEVFAKDRNQALSKGRDYHRDEGCGVKADFRAKLATN